MASPLLTSPCLGLKVKASDRLRGGDMASTGVVKPKWRAEDPSLVKIGKNTNADSDYEYALAA